MNGLKILFKCWKSSLIHLHERIYYFCWFNFFLIFIQTWVLENHIPLSKRERCGWYISFHYASFVSPGLFIFVVILFWSILANKILEHYKSHEPEIYLCMFFIFILSFGIKSKGRKLEKESIRKLLSFALSFALDLIKKEFFILEEIQTTYRDKDSFVVKKCCNFIPFEILDHGNSSRIKIIFYIICHICRRVQSPVHDIGCFCKEWHLNKNPPDVDKT